MNPDKTTSAGKWSVALALVPAGIVLMLLLLVMAPVWTGHASGEAGWGVMMGLAIIYTIGSHALTVTSLLGIAIGALAVRKTAWRQGAAGLLLNLSVLLLAGAGLTMGYYRQAVDPARLRMAVQREDCQTVETLLDRGFDVNYLYGQATVLDMAVEQGREPMVELLLSRGADVNLGSSLEKAVVKGNLKILKLLLDHDASGVSNTLKKVVMGEGKADLRALTMLLEYGADPNCLHIRSTEVACLLLEHGADVNQRNREGQSPLHTAAQTNNTLLIETLLEADADINAQDERGFTPLHAAIDWHSSKATQLLVNRKADLNRQDKNGRTPLHILLTQFHGDPLRQQWQIELCDLLLVNGADPEMKDSQGRSPLQLRRSMRSVSRKDAQFEEEILQQIQKYGRIDK